MNQNLTYVRETTTLIHSNAVVDIDQDLYLILQGWETSTPPKWQQQQQQVAQGQYVVSDTRCPAFHGCKSE